MLREVTASFLSRAGQTSISVELEDSDVTQADVLRALDHGRLYEHETSMLLLRVLEAGDVFIDIGANVGFFSILSGKLVGPTGHVFAIELNPRHHDHLQRHMALNDVAATVLPIAVGKERGRSWFGDGGPLDGNGILLRAADDSPTQMIPAHVVPMDTLDNLADAHARLGQAKAIKIDVEGAEGWVLMGAQRLLGRDTLEVVIIEANPPVQEVVFDVSFEKIRDMMLAHGFEAYIMPPNSELPTHIPRNIHIQFNIVCNVAFVRPHVLPRYWPSVDNIPARCVFQY